MLFKVCSGIIIVSEPAGFLLKIIFRKCGNPLPEKPFSTSGRLPLIRGNVNHEMRIEHPRKEVRMENPMQTII